MKLKPFFNHMFIDDLDFLICFYLPHTFLLNSFTFFYIFSNYDTIPLSISGFANIFCLFYYCWKRSRKYVPSRPMSWTLTFSPLTSSLALGMYTMSTFSTPGAVPGPSLDSVRCFRYHLDGMCG